MNGYPSCTRFTRRKSDLTVKWEQMVRRIWRLETTRRCFLLLNFEHMSEHQHHHNQGHFRATYRIVVAPTCPERSLRVRMETITHCSTSVPERLECARRCGCHVSNLLYELGAMQGFLVSSVNTCQVHKSKEKVIVFSLLYHG